MNVLIMFGLLTVYIFCATTAQAVLYRIDRKEPSVLLATFWPLLLVALPLIGFAYFLDWWFDFVSGDKA